MKVELIIPIERLRGKLRKDGYYFRMYRGQQIVQRDPDDHDQERVLAEGRHVGHHPDQAHQG